MTFTEVEIARVNEYWNERPCNIRHSAAPVGTKEYFDQVEARKYFVEYHIPGFAEFERWRWQEGAGNRVRGRDGYSQFCAGGDAGDDRGPFGKVDGAGATARRGVRPEDRISFCAGNAEQLSAFVPPEPYDLIYSFGVIHHTPNPDTVLEQLRQYTRPGTT
jgi:hypothetical protein